MPLSKTAVYDTHLLNLERGMSAAKSTKTIAEKLGKSQRRIEQIVKAESAKNVGQVPTQKVPTSFNPNVSGNDWIEGLHDFVNTTVIKKNTPTFLTKETQSLSEKLPIISDSDDEILEISNDVEAYNAPKRYECPVCAYPDLEDEPINHEICPRCKTQFGYDDFNTSHAELRLKWLANNFSRVFHKVDLPIQASEDFEIAPLEKPNLPKEKRVKLTKSQVELFATDVHFPFEEKTGWELFLQVAKDTQPDILWLNGDILDGFAVAQWDKDPNTAHENNIQFEFDYCRNKIEELRTLLPNARFYYKEGNHETRLQRFLNKNAPALRCLKSLTVLFNLQLEKLEVEWIENNDKFKLGNLWHLHGNEIGGSGANVALAKLRKIMANCIFGHYHIEQSALMRQYDGTPIGAWAIASLCDFQQDYVHFAETWTNGFARIEYLASGLFHVQPTQILKDGNKKMCRVDGHWFEKEIVE